MNEIFRGSVSWIDQSAYARRPSLKHDQVNVKLMNWSTDDSGQTDFLNKASYYSVDPWLTDYCSNLEQNQLSARCLGCHKPWINSQQGSPNISGGFSLIGTSNRGFPDLCFIAIKSWWHTKRGKATIARNKSQSIFDWFRVLIFYWFSSAHHSWIHRYYLVFEKRHLNASKIWFHTPYQGSHDSFPIAFS